MIDFFQFFFLRIKQEKEMEEQRLRQQEIERIKQAKASRTNIIILVELSPVYNIYIINTLNLIDGLV